jgi:hypothetical protein
MNGMSSRLTNGEKRLVAYSKHAIIEYNKMRHSRGGVDTLYSFILSDRGPSTMAPALNPISSKRRYVLSATPSPIWCRKNRTRPRLEASSLPTRCLRFNDVARLHAVLADTLSGSLEARAQRSYCFNIYKVKALGPFPEPRSMPLRLFTPTPMSPFRDFGTDTMRPIGANRSAKQYPAGDLNARDYVRRSVSVF